VSFNPSMLGADEDKFLAAVEMIRRTGSTQFQLRWSDDEEPTVWFAVATYGDGAAETDASLSPCRAVLRLCERLVDGGHCTHCGRPTGLDPDSLETMPLDDLVCWYQYDPELKTFRRGCEGEGP
jgi:hypothetical protein